MGETCAFHAKRKLKPGPRDEESNRRFADSAGRKLQELGAALVPRHPGELTPSELEMSPDVLDALARNEHVRWTDDLLALGWKRGEGPKDPESKRHPSLVPWENLPEVEREKDRDSIRALPVILAAAGYSIALEPAGKPAQNEPSTPT